MIDLFIGNWQRVVAYGVVFLAVASSVWMHGYSRGERKLYEYQAEQARAAVPVIVKQGAVTEKIITKYRTKVVEVKAAAEVITKEIVRYVPPAADPVLGLGWLRLHDAAALGAVSQAPPGADVTTPAIAASQALAGVVGNYGTCHGTEQQLLALQQWVAHQYETMNQQPLRYLTQ